MALAKCILNFIASCYSQGCVDYKKLPASTKAKSSWEWNDLVMKCTTNVFSSF